MQTARTLAAGRLPAIRQNVKISSTHPWIDEGETVAAPVRRLRTDPCQRGTGHDCREEGARPDRLPRRATGPGALPRPSRGTVVGRLERQPGAAQPAPDPVGTA